MMVIPGWQQAFMSACHDNRRMTYDDVVALKAQYPDMPAVYRVLPGYEKRFQDKFGWQGESLDGCLVFEFAPQNEEGYRTISTGCVIVSIPVFYLQRVVLA